MIILEIMSNIERMRAVIEGVKHCGLPLWIGLSCEIYSEGNSLLYESTQTQSEAISSLSDNHSNVICIMHTDVSDKDDFLDVLGKIGKDRLASMLTLGTTLTGSGFTIV